MTKRTHSEVQYIDRSGKPLDSVETFMRENHIFDFDADQISEVVSNFAFAALLESLRGFILEDENGYYPTEFLLQNFVNLTDSQEMYIRPQQQLRFYFNGLLKITFYRAEIMMEV